MFKIGGCLRLVQKSERIRVVGRESKACRRGGCGCLEGSRQPAKLEQRVVLGEN